MRSRRPNESTMGIGRKTAQAVVLTFWLLWICAEASAASPAGTAAGPFQPSLDKRMAVVIEDLGSGLAGTEEVMSAPVRLTVAVLPFMPATKQDAERAHRAGHDVIVHLPLEPLRGKRKGTGPDAMIIELTDDEIRQRVERAINDVPYAVGVNHHMGSKATADERVMRIVLQLCKERGLFYLDSKVNTRSVASKIGSEIGVKVMHSHIVLDDIASTTHISQQFEQALKLLTGYDSCIAIGHVGIPGKKTAGVLHQTAPFVSRNIRFVGLSELAGHVRQNETSPE